MTQTNRTDTRPNWRSWRMLLSGALWITFAVFGPACGVGTGGLADSGGISGTGISSGPITGFGSIFVNDVEWEIAGASIDLDGSPGSESKLQRGMVVRVRGTFAPGGATGRATSVAFDDSVEGPIDSAPSTVAPGVIRFQILGVPVIAHEASTQFADGASFAGLKAGDVVEVSGLPDANGNVVATRIELRPPGSTDVELRGQVAGLMTNLSEFMLGNVTVQYDAGTIFRSGLTSSADLMDGQRVEVEGVLVAPLRIEADVIEREDDAFGLDDADEAKLRGFVSNLTGGDRFSVSGVSVDATRARFDPSNLVLANGDYVEVEGRLSGGTLIAEKVELEDLNDQDGDPVEFEAAVPSGGIGAFGPGTLDLLGVQVQMGVGTRFEDKRDDLEPFTFGDLAEGDWLEVRAVSVASDIVVATRLERDDVRSDVILQGEVTALDVGARTLSILGQPITRAAGVQYRGIDDLPLSEAGFFNAIQLGDIVKAKDQNAADPAILGAANELSIEQFD